jgi:uroporphyrinogen decarboxylase
MRIPIKKPKPDVDSFVKIMKGEMIPDRVHFAELFLDLVVTEDICSNIIGRQWVPKSDDRKEREKYWENYIYTYYSLGYDFIKPSGGLEFRKKLRKSKDNAAISKNVREWTETGTGIISNWEDFANYDWPEVTDNALWDYEYVAAHLPEGMGIFIMPTAGVLETVSEELMGYETLSLLLYDDPELVKAVFNKVGETIFKFYKKLVGLPNFKGIFQGDDMGFNTATLFSPDMLREYVLPWHKKAARLCHENNGIYMLHSCGNIEAIMDELIDSVKIDAKHSFEDGIMPVTEFKKKYGDRIGVIGGVDMDKLCRLPEDELRTYIRKILVTCMEGGRYAFGSGNSIANYIPLKNYFIMLEEGYRFMEWK